MSNTTAVRVFGTISLCSTQRSFWFHRMASRRARRSLLISLVLPAWLGLLVSLSTSSSNQVPPPPYSSSVSWTRAYGSVRTGQATVLICKSPAFVQRWDVTTTTCNSAVNRSYSIDKEILVHACIKGDNFYAKPVLPNRHIEFRVEKWALTSSYENWH
jgi:hypothetical protein